ncbi:UNVERIFIED_CONTAM: hypothetical protein FKN15_050920 [Acipenser sinensis]
MDQRTCSGGEKDLEDSRRIVRVKESERKKERKKETNKQTNKQRITWLQLWNGIGPRVVDWTIGLNEYLNPVKRPFSEPEP